MYKLDLASVLTEFKWQLVLILPTCEKIKDLYKLQGLLQSGGWYHITNFPPLCSFDILFHHPKRECHELCGTVVNDKQKKCQQFY